MLFNNYPIQLREVLKQQFKNQAAIKFPAAYVRTYQLASHKDWIEASTLTDGMLVRIGPTWLIDTLIQHLDKYEQKYEMFTI